MFLSIENPLYEAQKLLSYIFPFHISLLSNIFSKTYIEILILYNKTFLCPTFCEAKNFRFFP